MSATISPLPHSEPVRVSFGFELHGEAVDIRIETADGGFMVGTLRIDRRDLGAMLSGRYGLPGHLRLYDKKVIR